jgi:hypothetical protein
MVWLQEKKRIVPRISPSRTEIQTKPSTKRLSKSLETSTPTKPYKADYMLESYLASTPLSKVSRTRSTVYNQSNPNPDDHLENWQPLMANLGAFVAKKKQLQKYCRKANEAHHYRNARITSEDD